MDRIQDWDWKSVPLDDKTREQLETEFELDVYRGAVERNPRDIDSLVRLGDLYARMGLIREGLDVDLRLVDICPDEKVFHYNLACSYSLLNQVDQALLALEKALLLGYDDFEHMMRDKDLANLREDDRFHRLLRQHSKG